MGHEIRKEIDAQEILNRAGVGPDSNLIDPKELLLRLQRNLADKERVDRKSRISVASHSVSIQHRGTNR